MKTLYIILCVLLIVLSASILIAYTISYLRNKKEIDAKADEEMRKKYPNWPYVERPKTHFASFPLSLWNDPD